MSWGVLLVGDQPARQRYADRGPKTGRSASREPAQSPVPAKHSAKRGESESSALRDCTGRDRLSSAQVNRLPNAMICGRVKTDTGDHEQQAGPYRFQEVDRPGERATVPRFDPPSFLGVLC